MIKKYTGLDIQKDKILVSPMEHYAMGGLEVSDYQTCATRVDGIFAAGECSCMSIHGANRIGSNSTAEALVFGRTAGLGAAAFAKTQKESGHDVLDQSVKKWDENFAETTSRTEGYSLPNLRHELATTLWLNAGPLRSASGLMQAEQDLSRLDEAYANCVIGDSSRLYNTSYAQYVELGSMLKVAHAVVKGASARQESRGSHFRTDFPKQDNAHFLKHTLVSYADGRYDTTWQDVAITKYPPTEGKA